MGVVSLDRDDRLENVSCTPGENKSSSDTAMAALNAGAGAAAVTAVAGAGAMEACSTAAIGAA